MGKNLFSSNYGSEIKEGLREIIKEKEEKLTKIKLKVENNRK